MGHVRNITYTHGYTRWHSKILRIRTVVKQIKAKKRRSGKKEQAEEEEDFKSASQIARVIADRVVSYF